MYEELNTVELKETISNTFLKTVSAFANYQDGEIIFGVADNGEIKGIKNINELCDAIESKIIDTIQPMPDFSLEIDHLNKIVKVLVKKGFDTPYLYKNKAYIRNHKSTVEVDRLHLNRLILKGQNITFESLECENQDLTFKYLENKFKNSLALGNFSEDVAKSLGLMNKNEKYNNAGALFSDKNNYQILDIVKFGDNIDEILFRKTSSNCCVLQAFDKAIDVYSNFLQIEKIDGFERKSCDLIPKVAFREALLNALLHRTWDVPICSKVTIYSDRVEIYSPGGLPSAISEDDYLNKQISFPRNLIMCSIFYRLGLIEKFGTGILRIINSYKNYLNKPKFEIDENWINIILPFINQNIDMSADEKVIVGILDNSVPLSSANLSKLSKFSQSKVTYICKHLAELGIVKISGNGRSTKYSLK